MMDDGELPVDANGEYVAGVPVDPRDPRTKHMKPAGKSSPPTRNGVRLYNVVHALRFKLPICCNL